MGKFAIITAHASADSLQDAVQSWGYDGVSVDMSLDNTVGLKVEGQEYALIVANGTHGMLRGYQIGFEATRGFNVLAYLHDDLLIMDPDWIPKVLAQFEDPKVGLVGFGGSQQHGSPDLYKTPYHISQLSRGKFLSNLLDAEVHGFKYDGPPIDVATLDGFALIFRRELLERAGGFPVGNLLFHGYDFWSTCIAHRLGYRVRLVPIKALHLGGKTSVQRAMDPAGSHESGHQWIYSEFKDVLPWRVDA